jgi:hypothetical protein
VRGSMSANTTRAPRSAKADAVETKVKLGTMTSSPGPIESRSAASSRAWVHEVVRRTGAPSTAADTSALARRVNGPSPRQ